MTQSMTAFSSYQLQTECAYIHWELKSINHRYLDINFRLPEAARSFEPLFRQIIGQHLTRGKVECHLKMTLFEEAADYQVSMHESLVNALIQAGQAVSQHHQIPNDVTTNTLLTWPGVVEISRSETDALKHHLSQTFSSALTELVTSRQQEGAALAHQIIERLSKMSLLLSSARHIAQTSRSNTKEKLLQRLEQLKLSVDEQRIEQEIALMLTRLDVSEELDRIETHIIEAKRVISDEHVQGRRLDFLMQEFNREANTLSSKSDSSELTKQAVEMKVVIDQMREQIQNIE